MREIQKLGRHHEGNHGDRLDHDVSNHTGKHGDRVANDDGVQEDHQPH